MTFAAGGVLRTFAQRVCKLDSRISHAAAPTTAAAAGSLRVRGIRQAAVAEPVDSAPGGGPRAAAAAQVAAQQAAARVAARLAAASRPQP